MTTTNEPEALGERIEDALQDGALTFPELLRALGMGGTYAHAEVSEALRELIRERRVKELAAPTDTPEVDQIPPHQVRAAPLTVHR